MLRSTTLPRGVPTLHTDASGPAPPDAFGPFRVLHQIGVGVLGPVFRAYQADPGRLVAVKQFRLDLPPETAHRFVASLDRVIAADLTHPGIATPLAAGLTDVWPYLAQDFVAAESFDVVIRNFGPAAVRVALRLATQVGGALDFAAAANVFHGALHPRDVLVSAEDTWVTGLGLAQVLEGLGVAPPIRRPYTAPERVAGAGWNRRADVFSLAALVFEVFAGRRLVGVGREAAETVTPIEGSDIERLRAVFARALAEDPAERFDTALGFADALHSAVNQPARPAREPRARRRREGQVLRERAVQGPARRASLPLDTPSELPLMRPPDAPLAQHHEMDQIRSDSTTDPDPSSDPVVEPEVPVAQSLALFTAPPDIVASTERVLPAVDAIDGGRSVTWPIALALVVGLLVGFAFGFGAGTRDRTYVPESAGGSASPAGAPVPPAPEPAAAAAVAPAAPPAPPPGAMPQPPEQMRPRPTAPARPASVVEKQRLLVRSSPGGALVSVNGRDAGVTPLSVPNLPAGAYVVRISRQGYVTAERRVRIRTAQPTQPIDVDLVVTRAVRAVAPRPAAPEPTNGSLMVDSRPAGAQVFVDGKLVGTTPLLLDAVRAGRHGVRLELNGFTPWTMTAPVSGGERSRISGSLERR